MKTATVTDFRQKLKEHLNEIHDDQDILILTGPKKMDFVVLTLDAFNALEESAHLMSTTANARRLMGSIAQDNAGKAVVRQLDTIRGGASSQKKSSASSKRASRRKRMIK